MDQTVICSNCRHESSELRIGDRCPECRRGEMRR